MTRPSDAAIALKPCPFCKGPADYTGCEGRGYNVECKHCGARSGWGDYGCQVRAKWNRRAIDAEAKDVAGETGAVVDPESLSRDATRWNRLLADNAVSRDGTFCLFRDVNGNLIHVESGTENEYIDAAIASAPTAVERQ